MKKQLKALYRDLRDLIVEFKDHLFMTVAALALVGVTFGMVSLTHQQNLERIALDQRVPLQQMETDLTRVGIEVDNARFLATLHYNGAVYLTYNIVDGVLRIIAALDNLLSPDEQQLQRLQRGR